MRWIIFPSDVQLMNETKDPPQPMLDERGKKEPAWTFLATCVRVFLPDPAFGKGYGPDRARRRITEAVRDASREFAKDGWACVGIEDEHFDFLKKAVESPEGIMDNRIRMQLYPHQEAVMEAKDRKPKAPTSAKKPSGSGKAGKGKKKAAAKKRGTNGASASTAV